MTNSVLIRETDRLVNNHWIGDWDVVDAADHYRLGVSVKQSCTVGLGRSNICHDLPVRCV